MFISSLTFFTGFAASRAVTHWIRSHPGKARNASVGGRHIHHLVFGIGGLLGVGYMWLTGFGTPQSRPPAFGNADSAPSSDRKSPAGETERQEPATAAAFLVTMNRRTTPAAPRRDMDGAGNKNDGVRRGDKGRRGRCLSTKPASRDLA